MSAGAILIGYVDRDEGRDALALGRELADVTGGPMLLVGVFPYGSAGMGTEVLEGYLEADGERLFADPKAELGELIETRAISGRSPAKRLQEIAEEESAATIVVGSTHRGPVGRVLLGSVGERLLQGAPCPVAVAPRGYAAAESHALQRLAVAFDGSPESRGALAHARELAARTHARIDVVAVNEPWLADAPLAFRFAEVGETEDVDRFERDRGDELRRGLDEALGELPEATRGEAVLLSGDAVGELGRWAGEEGVELLVTGSRGYGPTRRVLLGGFSAGLARAAPCPLLVVPRAG